MATTSGKELKNWDIFGLNFKHAFELLSTRRLDLAI